MNGCTKFSKKKKKNNSKFKMDDVLQCKVETHLIYR